MERLVYCFAARNQEIHGNIAKLGFYYPVEKRERSPNFENGPTICWVHRISKDKIESVLDTTKQFTTDEIFNSREALLNWSRVQGRKRGFDPLFLFLFYLFIDDHFRGWNQCTVKLKEE
ncbi:unnamed protein product [Prunus armeniaca]